MMILRVLRSTWTALWTPIASLRRSLVPNFGRGAIVIVLGLGLALSWGVSQGRSPSFAQGRVRQVQQYEPAGNIDRSQPAKLAIPVMQAFFVISAIWGTKDLRW
jgi:hypothetical protein